MRKSKLGDPTKAVGYLRVSKDEQHLGPDAQLAALQRWAESRGIELVGVHTDLGVSGGAPIDKRPGLLSAIDDLKAKGAGLFLVAKRDRLARDIVIAAMIERLVDRNGGRVTSADGAGNGHGPEAELMRGIIDCFGQYERGLIRSRTTAALAVKASRGERVGGIPFGYRLADDGTHLHPDPAEQTAIDRIRELRESGLSLRRIVSQLNTERIPARGRKWHLTTVTRLLNRETIAAAQTAA